MKITRTILAAMFLTSTATAQSLEALRISADAAFLQALPQAMQPGLGATRNLVQKPLSPLPANMSRTPGPVIGKVVLSSLLSANRHIMARQLGTRTLDLGIASNADFSQKFFTFSDAKTTTLAPFGSLSRLRDPGVNARIDAQTEYNFKIIVKAFSPLRSWPLKATPTQGTSGPTHNMKTGDLLDAIRAKSFVFTTSGRELWLSYDSDVLPDGSGFADTRSFVFTHEDGLSSKAWPLAEAKLPLDSGVSVNLDGLKLNLTRTSAGELIIRE